MQIVITADSSDLDDRNRAEDVAIGYARMFGIKLKLECEGGCIERTVVKTDNDVSVSITEKFDVKNADQLDSLVYRVPAKPHCIPVNIQVVDAQPPETEEVTLLSGQELVEVNGVKMAVYPVGYIPPTPEPLDTAAIFGDQNVPATVDVPPPPSAATTPPPALVPAQTMNVAPPAPLGSAQPVNATVSNPVTGVELDKDGIPWDPRIHSEKKSKNADETWRLKRGVDKEVVTLVKEELKGLMGTPIAVKPGTPPPVIQAVTEQPVIGVFPAFTRELAPHMRSATNPEGKLTPEYLNELAKYLGVVNPQGDGMFSMMIHRPDAIPLMRAEIIKAIGEL